VLKLPQSPHGHHKFSESIPTSLRLAHHIHLNFATSEPTNQATSPDGHENNQAPPSTDQALEVPTRIHDLDAEDLDSRDGFHGLTTLCNETKWTNRLWLHCHSRCGTNNTSVCGGLNNARNRVQTGLRLAIDAGRGLILPSATMRDEKNMVKTDDKTVCPDMFCNIEYLQTSLAKHCPQFQIRQCDDRTGIDKVIEAPQRSYIWTQHI
jgi:hypothetical protein